MDKAIDTIFVGRERELAMLRGEFDEVFAGRGRVLLLTGEPGVGKTRLASELATDAQRRGAQVLWGRCYEEEGAPPFWPWVQILRSYVTACDRDTLSLEMGHEAVDIARLVPEVRDRLPVFPQPVDLESEQARFRLFDSVTLFLKRASARIPLVLILDDLHWADVPSLLLLQFLVREIGAARLLLIGTYRDITLNTQHPLAHALGEVVRTPGSQIFSLQGLSEQDVACLIEHSGLQIAPPLTASLYRATEGNPFFLSEIVRLFLNSDELASRAPVQPLSSFPLPQSVRAAIHHRLQALSDESQEVLTLAAVIGREFEMKALEALGATVPSVRTSEQLLAVLEEALAARIIVEIPRLVGRYSFSHALIRETLYEELSVARRVRLHRQIGDVLEKLYVPESALPTSTRSRYILAELAYHFVQAVPGGGEVAKALAYATRAGDQAMAALAYEDAILHYQRALQAWELQDGADESQHCELLLAVGTAQRKAGELTSARDTFERAAALARRLWAREGGGQAAAFLARAALGFGGEVWVEHGLADAPLVALLEEALSALGADEPLLRARVLGRLAGALFRFPGTRERSATLSQQAVELARQGDDLVTMAYALNSRHWALWGDTDEQERLAIATEIVQLAERAGSRELALIGHGWRMADLMELGEVAEADAEAAIFARLAAAVPQPLYQWWTLMFQTMRAILDGRFAEAEHMAQQALMAGQQVHPPTAAAVFALQFGNLRRQQGRLQELIEAHPALLSPIPLLPQVVMLRKAARILLYCDLGRKAEARQELEALPIQDFMVPLGGGEASLLGVGLLAQACATLAATHHAATLYDMLQPYAGRTILSGGIGSYICLGAVSRYLGLLAATLSRWQEAEAHFRDALALNTRMGARPYVARTQQDYASMLLARNQSGDRERARDLLTSALATAQELGMAELEEKVKSQQLKGQAEGFRLKASGMPPSAPYSLQPIACVLPQPSTPNLCRHDGEYWTLAYQGQVCHLKHAKGLQYIATLLRHPGQEFHVLDLEMMSEVQPTSPTARSRSESAESPATLRARARPTNTGPVLDAQATALYKQRLAELREERAEAQQFNDLARLEKVQTEIDFLTNELAGAYGLGGRARKGADPTERVRKTVTNNIRNSLAKIHAAHPPLWRHLLAALKTGAFCSYLPPQPISWEG